ncbi:MAG: ABC transporter permease subunit [Pseudomonadota bacterium]
MNTINPTLGRPLGKFLSETINFGPIFGALIIFLGWELAARTLEGSFVLVGPVEVAAYLVNDWQLLSRALIETLRNAIFGFLVGNLAAIILAAMALIWPRSERVIAGLALIVFCLPLVATGPIFRVFFGPGAGPQITLAALAVYYTTLIPLLVGLRAMPDAWLDLVRSYGRGRMTALFRVRARASLPYLFTGLQIAAPAAFLGAMVGEFTGAERGLGVLTVRAIRALDVQMTWGIAIIATAIAIAAYVAVSAIGRLVLKEAPPVILSGQTEKRQSGRSVIAETLLTLAVAVALWQASIWIFDLNPFFAKSPADLFHALVLAPSAPDLRTTVFNALAETLVFLLPGYVAGLASGALLAMLLVLVPALAGTTLPLAIALRSVPIVTTAPLLVLILGRGATGTIVLVAVMVFFPTFVACMQGLQQAPGQIMSVMDSYRAGPLVKLMRVRIPAMLPAFFASARMAVPASVLAVTVVEWLATGSGIGSLMALSASLSNYNVLWSSVVLVALLSALGYSLVGMIERRVLRVYAPEQLA